jgi:GrpB-like predicted nucleotidyltransferase (UPF0157 family)
MLIQPYQEKWIEDFKAIKEVLNNALMPLNVTIEHVGSTAVPELAAKPIIDIDIVFGDDVDFNDIKKSLEKIGYFHNGNQGILNREVFKRRELLVLHKILDNIVHHLYVCLNGSEALQRHILFRDYLIAHPEARIQYQNMKYDIAQEVHQDRKKYAELKEVVTKDFIDDIIEKAKGDIKH